MPLAIRNEMTKTRYPSLNGLRAFSILLVIIHHLNLKHGLLAPLQGIRWLEPILFFIQDGDLGVNVFFVISGFLITSLMLNEEAATKTVSLKKFYARRTLRIFPAYYFLLLVYMALQLAHVIHIDRTSWITAITYTKYFNWYGDWYTSHAWSLSIEEQFYLCWPLIFLAGANFRKAGAVIMIAMVPCVRLYLHLHPSPWFNDLNFFTRIDAIATGCLFALYKDRILEALRPRFTLLFYICFVILFAFPYLPAWAGMVYLDSVFVPLGLAHGTIGNFLVAIILMYSVFGPQRVWYKLLNLRAVNYIGLLSYSIYLWQQIFTGGDNWWVTGMPQSLLCIAVMSLFSYYVIEKPFNKLRSRFAVLE